VSNLARAIQFRRICVGRIVSDLDGDDGVNRENKVPEDPVGFLQDPGNRGQILWIYHTSMCRAVRVISRVVIPAAVDT
jgi:hypothetical protein